MVKKVNVENGSKVKIPFKIKKSLSFQLTKNIGAEPGIADNKIRYNSILILRKNKHVGRKRDRELEIVDAIHIKGLQNLETQANILNPVDIDIENDRLWNFAPRYEGRGYFYRFTKKTLLSSANIKNGTKTIFITYNGLNDAKQLLYTRKIIKH